MVPAIALALQPNVRRPLMSLAALALIVAFTLALLALLVVAAVLLAGPHLVSAAQPFVCGSVPGSCYAPLG